MKARRPHVSPLSSSTTPQKPPPISDIALASKRAEALARTVAARAKASAWSGPPRDARIVQHLSHVVVTLEGLADAAQRCALMVGELDRAIEVELPGVSAAQAQRRSTMLASLRSLLANMHAELEVHRRELQDAPPASSTSHDA